jgi:tetratricopeptide (TPR) repeat protein
LDRAVELVQGGGNPMEGIGLLKEVLDEDPDNVDALMYLGVFSMQSGQFDKAVGRFETIIGNGGSFPLEAYYYLGVSQANLGQKEKAIENLTRFKELVDDESTIKEVEIYINNLKNQ